MNEKILQEHNKTQPHKRKVKLAMEKQYTQREAEAGAGMGAPDNGRPLTRLSASGAARATAGSTDVDMKD